MTGPDGCSNWRSNSPHGTWHVQDNDTSRPERKAGGATCLLILCARHDPRHRPQLRCIRSTMLHQPAGRAAGTAAVRQSGSGRPVAKLHDLVPHPRQPGELADGGHKAGRASLPVACAKCCLGPQLCHGERGTPSASRRAAAGSSSRACLGLGRGRACTVAAASGAVATAGRGVLLPLRMRRCAAARGGVRLLGRPCTCGCCRSYHFLNHRCNTEHTLWPHFAPNKACTAGWHSTRFFFSALHSWDPLGRNVNNP